MTAKVLSFVSNTDPNTIQYDQSQRKRLLVFYINARYQRGREDPVMQLISSIQPR